MLREITMRLARRQLVIIAAAVLLFAGEVCAQRAPALHGLLATLHTAKGEIVVQLFPDKAPKTVENFVGLAKGTKPFKDPTTNSLATRPLYDGLLFFRTIPRYIIQTGDPANTGTGDIGFTIENESNDLKFDRPGRLSMAQVSGEPRSRASQVFITLGPAPDLDKEHFIIFGQVVRGMPVARAIAAGPHKKDGETPLRPVLLKSVTIEQK